MNDKKDLYLQILNILNIKTATRITPEMSEVMCSCCWHKDTRPSMGIDLDRGLYHCFSCNRSGTLENLFKDMTGQSIYSFLGINETKNSFIDFSNKKQPVFTNLFSNNLSSKDIRINYNPRDFLDIESNSNCVDYLKKRGISIKTAHNMGFKYCEETRINGTLFKRRLLIPVYENKKLISVEGRRIFSEDPDPKVLYPKNSSVNTLFDIDNLNKKDTLYVLEGLMDLAVLREDSFFKNSTSIFGAGVTEKQINLLKEFNKVVYIPDLDNAGLNTLEKLRRNNDGNFFYLKPPKIINNTPIKDIGDLTKANITIKDLLKRRWLNYEKKLI